MEPTANSLDHRETLLVVDDSQDWIETCRDILVDQGFKVLTSTSAENAFELLQKLPVDLVLTDLSMPGWNGLKLIQKIQEIDLGCAIILMTAYPSVESAITTLKSGVLDYLIKPFSPEQLVSATKNALDRSALSRENQFLKARLAYADPFGEIIGKSQKILSLFSDMERAACMDSNVLITGESGTGKELVARLLHRRSNRSKNHFVPINCAAIPSELLESELFGHETGAFTGATQPRIGLFENADHGTVFLDEIGEMPLQLQAKLLRVIEDRKVRRLGSNKERTIDIRIISATHNHLQNLVKENRFREDLYFRLNVINLDIPPLRERKEDILLLLQHFLKFHETKSYPAPKEIPVDVKEGLLQYRWPGNVRELSNLAQFLIFANRDGAIRLQQLPAHFLEHLPTTTHPMDLENALESSAQDLLEKPFPEAIARLSHVFEKIYFCQNLIKYNWNISETADKTQIDRRTLHRWIKKLNLHRPEN